MTLFFLLFPHRELEALGKELEHLSHIKESVEDKVFEYIHKPLCVCMCTCACVCECVCRPTYI